MFIWKAWSIFSNNKTINITWCVINKEYVFTPERLGQLTCLFIYKVSHGKQASINSALKYSTPPSVFSDLSLWVN